MRTITFTIMTIVVGVLFAFLEGGSTLLCPQAIPGETPVSPDAFRPLNDIAHSHLVLCVTKKGLASLLVILLGSFVPLAWIGAIWSAIVYVPRFAVLGVGMGLVGDSLVCIINRSKGSGDGRSVRSVWDTRMYKAASVLRTRSDGDDDALDQIVIYDDE